MSYVAKHSKQRKTTKLVKLQWIASIWCQNGQKPQNYKRNQIRINLHRFEVKTIKNVELRRKSFKTTQNYESHQITMNCIDLMSKTSNQRKTTKVILFGWICIDLTSERSKQRKTTKVIKLQWIASIWCQNDQKSQNYKSNQITINLHRFDVKTIKNVELRPKTTKAIELLSMCIDLTSKRSKMLSYVAKHSKQRKTTKVIKLQWIASIWCQKHQTNAKLQKWSYFDEFASIWRQNDQNNAKLRKWSNYNAMHRFDVETIKTTQNYNTDQITMNCIDLMSKRSKIAKLLKRSNYNALHRFDVKTI